MPRRQETAFSRDPGPAEMDGLGCHEVPFHHWLPSGPNAMQLVAVAQDRLVVQVQVPKPVQIVPRLGETSVQALVLAFHVPASATSPFLTSLNPPPAAMQNEQAQETPHISRGFPFFGGRARFHRRPA